MGASPGGAPPPPHCDGLVSGMIVHLIDGTYELFRHSTGRAGSPWDSDRPRRCRLSVGSTPYCRLIAEGATHLGVATDHVIEAFATPVARVQNGRRHGACLLAPIPSVGGVLCGDGITDWAMVEHEADDALGAAAAVADRMHGWRRLDRHPGQRPRAVRTRRPGRAGR